MVLSIAAVMMAMLVLEAGTAVAQPAICDIAAKYPDNAGVQDIAEKYGC